MEVMKGSVRDILDNPDEYSSQEVDWAKFMSKKFDSVGGAVKYNEAGLKMLEKWTLEYVKEHEEGLDEHK